MRDALPITFTFKAKAENVYSAKDLNTVLYVEVKVPKPKPSHVNLNAMRADSVWSGIANSQMLLGAVAGALRVAGVGSYLKLNALPAGVTVDTSGYLVSVTVEIPTYRKPAPALTPAIEGAEQPAPAPYTLTPAQPYAGRFATQDVLDSATGATVATLNYASASDPHGISGNGGRLVPVYGTHKSTWPALVAHMGKARANGTVPAELESSSFEGTETMRAAILAPARSE